MDGQQTTKENKNIDRSINPGKLWNRLHQIPIETSNMGISSWKTLLIFQVRAKFPFKVSEKTTTTKYPRKKLEKMRKNYHHSRSLQPDYQDPQSNPTPFRTIEQYYKRRLWEPDYNLAFGHHSIPPPSITTTTTPATSPKKVEWTTPHQAQSIQAHIHPLPSNSSQPSIIKPCELCHPQSSPDRIFCTFPKQYPGLIYLPSYLCQHQQAELVEDCLTNGLRKPNVTNIDTHWEMPHQPGLYDLYRLWLNNENNQNQSEDQDQELDTQFILQPKPSETESRLRADQCPQLLGCAQ
ncbi:hypothetical protein PGTUg99_018417 [Puccinia graminis f. sp. tritici]|uniref:Uncharacterized protein n=1 Tax=Puccinia graminis f. sp. tritici TaxID=56615 RepID=A0A5B0S5X3_PUCGR|nr:hypothetical protein PGTUg99_018417 [Puccinia graminis f. sp. tritici]